MAEIEPTYIDVLIADPDSRVMLIGECKYRKGFDETFEVEDMDRKRDLIKGYHATDFYLFSRYRVAESTTVKYSTRADVHLIQYLKKLPDSCAVKKVLRHGAARLTGRR